MPDIDADLTSALKQAKKKAMYFAFIAKGTEGNLIVDKKAIPKKVLAEAKKEVGGGMIYSGQCQEEDGTMVFETSKEPPTTLANALKKTIKAKAGLTMNVAVRLNAELEEQEQSEPSVEETPTETAPPPSSGTAEAGAVTKRLNALTAAIKAALAGPMGNQIQPLFVSAMDLVKNNKHTQASAALDQIEALLKQSSAAQPPPAPPPVPDKDAATRATNRLKALMPVVQKLEASQAPRLNEVKQALKDATQQLAQKQIETCLQTLDSAEAMIKGALSAALPGGRDGLNAALARYQTARATVMGQLDRLIAALKADGDPDAESAIIEVRAIRANLSANPDNPQAVAELMRYLETDDVVADADEPNRFDIEVHIQVPLLEALDEIKLHLPS